MEYLQMPVSSALRLIANPSARTVQFYMRITLTSGTCFPDLSVKAARPLSPILFSLRSKDFLGDVWSAFLVSPSFLRPYD